MRVSQYKIVNELCGSVLEAYRIIESTKNLALLGDCIDALTIIAESIEEENCPKMESTISDMVELLPDNAANGNNMPRLVLLAEKLQKLAKKELKYRIRVLFVAELSSKWDSMESVYEAFKQRDDIDVDVVLEPIFRATKMPDDSVKSEIIYEDWLTPLGIENIPYTSYSIEKVQPDITFISQPYESVTVPMFWPENIAKYSRLVYLPYCMLKKLTFGSSFESFFCSPVEKYAWKIIAQSPKMKEYYKQYGSRKGENVIDCGLPKWDYALNINQSNTACPETWKKKIDGKIVFLYNTHFSRSIPSIKEMEENNIFKFVSERDDVALIWRPHPMTETIKKVYSPEEYDNYLELKQFVENSKNIVLDTNITYRESFAWSDVLIDSNSSLQTQYILMKKPVVVMTNTNDKEILDRVYAAKKDGLYDYYTFNVYNGENNEHKAILDNITNKLDIDWDEFFSLYYPNINDNIGIQVTERIIDSYISEM